MLSASNVLMKSETAKIGCVSDRPTSTKLTGMLVHSPNLGRWLDKRFSWSVLASLDANAQKFPLGTMESGFSKGSNSSQNACTKWQASFSVTSDDESKNNS